METKAKERNIGFEVMRIVSMLLIILLHSIDHSGAYENLAAGSALYYIGISFMQPYRFALIASF